jgi:hypothetical protein
MRHISFGQQAAAWFLNPKWICIMRWAENKSAHFPGNRQK